MKYKIPVAWLEKLNLELSFFYASKPIKKPHELTIGESFIVEHEREKTIFFVKSKAESSFSFICVPILYIDQNGIKHINEADNSWDNFLEKET